VARAGRLEKVHSFFSLRLRRKYCTRPDGVMSWGKSKNKNKNFFFFVTVQTFLINEKSRKITNSFTAAFIKHLWVIATSYILVKVTDPTRRVALNIWNYVWTIVMVIQMFTKLINASNLQLNHIHESLS